MKKESRKPLLADRVAKIWEYCKNEGVLLGKGGLHGNVIKFQINLQK
jgi:4-aminobutyrate aminotransferase-like enzyme